MNFMKNYSITEQQRHQFNTQIEELKFIEELEKQKEKFLFKEEKEKLLNEA